MAEPHILLTVVAGVPGGNPAPSAACRAGAWPIPADRTQPMMTSSICPPATPESASAALMAAEPSCGAVTVKKALGRPPPGGRRPAKITTGSDFIGHVPSIADSHY